MKVFIIFYTISYFLIGDYMIFLRNSLKPLFFTFVFIFVLTLIITLLNYVDLFGTKLTNVFKIIIPLFSILIGSILIGKKSINKGWLAGLKFSIIYLFITFLLNYLGFDKEYKLIDLISILLVIITSILGSIIGINRKLKK